MKFNLKSVLATSLAAIMACLPFVTLAKTNPAKAAIGNPVIPPIMHIGYAGTDHFEAGHIYMIVNNHEDAHGWVHAMAESQNGLFAAPIWRNGNIAAIDKDDTTVGYYANEDGMMPNIMRWIAVPTENGEIVLRNMESNKYLGCIYNMYTWSSIYSAKSVSVYSDGLVMHTYDSIDKYVASNGTGFTLSDNSDMNIIVFEEVRIPIMWPFGA